MKLTNLISFPFYDYFSSFKLNFFIISIKKRGKYGRNFKNEVHQRRQKIGKICILLIFNIPNITHHFQNRWKMSQDYLVDSAPFDYWRLK